MVNNLNHHNGAENSDDGAIHKITGHRVQAWFIGMICGSIDGSQKEATYCALIDNAEDRKAKTGIDDIQ